MARGPSSYRRSSGLELGGMQSTARARVSHLLKLRVADAVLRTRQHTSARKDDNAEEGIKAQESDRRARYAFRGCYRNSITGMLLVLYLTVPRQCIELKRLSQQASQDRKTKLIL